MALCTWLILAATIFQGTTATPARRAAPPADKAPIVQPGAPGQKSRVVTPEATNSRPQTLSEADISFMQGMVMHHSQAVEMTKLLSTRGASKDVQALGKRISISQTDEIKYMQQWLEERGKSPGMESMDDMKGMDHGDMKMPLMHMMPGMLTPQQMEALTKASGATFDHLFLTGMIQHHTGALTMVQDLFDTPGAGQDNILFDFATDVDNTQRAEIRIMQDLLAKEK